MNPMVMQLRMELSNAKREYSQKELRLKRLFFEIQTLANPYYTSLESIKAQELQQSANEMTELKDLMQTLDVKIKELQSQLGEV